MDAVWKGGNKALEQMFRRQVRRQRCSRCGGEEQGVAHPAKEEILKRKKELLEFSTKAKTAVCSKLVRESLATCEKTAPRPPRLADRRLSDNSLGQTFERWIQKQRSLFIKLFKEFTTYLPLRRGKTGGGAGTRDLLFVQRSVSSLWSVQLILGIFAGACSSIGILIYPEKRCLWNLCI